MILTTALTPRNTLPLTRFAVLRNRSAVLAGAMIAALAASGCTTDGYPTDNTYHYQGKAPSALPQPSTYAYRYPDVAPVLGAKDLQDMVGKFRHRVVLLDFWASWSRRTREEMMMLARLQEELEDEGFQVIACSFDSEEKWGSSTVPMLHAANANFPCVVIPESARPDIRKWLAPNWSYDLPARFVINRQGIITSQALAETSLGMVEQQARQAVNGAGGQMYGTKLTGTAAALRAKVVDCNSGKADSIPEVVAEPASGRRLAEQVAGLVEARIDRSKNPRVAILAFGDAKDRRKAGPLGREAADQLEAELKEKGFTDIIPAEQTQRILQDNGLSAMSIDYEPGFVKGKLGADYLIMGWLRTDAPKTGANVNAALRSDSRQPTVMARETPTDSSDQP